MVARLARLAQECGRVSPAESSPPHGEAPGRWGLLAGTLTPSWQRAHPSPSLTLVESGAYTPSALLSPTSLQGSQAHGSSVTPPWAQLLASRDLEPSGPKFETLHPLGPVSSSGTCGWAEMRSTSPELGPQGAETTGRRSP